MALGLLVVMVVLVWLLPSQDRLQPVQEVVVEQVIRQALAGQAEAVLAQLELIVQLLEL